MEHLLCCKLIFLYHLLRRSRCSALVSSNIHGFENVSYLIYAVLLWVILLRILLQKSRFTVNLCLYGFADSHYMNQISGCDY